MLKQDNYFEAFAEILTDLGIKAELINQAESYILGETDTLSDEFPTVNLDKAAGEVRSKLRDFFAQTARNSDYMSVYRRYIDVISEIGKSSADAVCYYGMMQANNISSSPEQEISMFAHRITASKYSIAIEHIKRIINMADGNPDIIKAAMKYHVSNCGNGLIILYSAYFKAERNANILNKAVRVISGILNKNDDEYKKLLADFEECVVSSVYNLFSVSKDNKDIKIIENYLNENIRADKDNPQITAIIDKYKKNANDYLLRLLGGLSYLNCHISRKLCNMVKVCLGINSRLMVRYIFSSFSQGAKEFMAFKKVFNIKTSDFFEMFANAPVFQIKDDNAVRQKYQAVLEALAQEYPSEYELYTDKQKNAVIYGFMNITYKKARPERYKAVEAEVQSKFISRMTDIILSQIENSDDKAAAEAYISGKCGIESIKNISLTHYDTDMSSYIPDYQSLFPESCAEFKRIIAFLFAAEGYDVFLNLFKSIYYHSNEDLRLSLEDEVKSIYMTADEQNIPFSYQLALSAKLIDHAYHSQVKTELENIIADYFACYYDKNPDDALNGFLSAPVSVRLMAIDILKEKSPSDIVSFFDDSSKAVREKVFEIISSSDSFEGRVMEKLSSKKASERLTAAEILSKYDKNKYAQTFKDMLENEKSAKVKAVLSAYLGLSEQTSEKKADSVLNIVTAGGKRSVAWAFENNIDIHDNDGNDGSDIMNAVLISFSKSGGTVPADGKAFAERLNKTELCIFVNNVFDNWIERGASAKQKWVLYLSSVFGGNLIISKLKHNINEWPKASRGAIAAEAVKALALNGSSAALMEVDSISRKFKFRQVKAAASNALKYAAEQLNISIEELADKIVPTLGFDEKMHQVFDYGTRKFDVYINAVPEIEIYNEDGKRLKNLPSPAKKDDEIIAKESNERFKLIKKQLKTVIAAQKIRLELALPSERRWSGENWKKLFIENPVMHCFAISLIWGTYDDKNNLISTFRYMEDGSFNTADEEEYELDGGSIIGLVHPVEIDDSLKELWLEQLSDYEITQPILQLERPVFRLEKEEEKLDFLERFGGRTVNALSFSGKLIGMGWYRGSVLDAGGYYNFFKEDERLKIGVEINFSGSYVGEYDQSDITVYHAVFYRGTVTRGSYVYENIEKENIIKLKDVPKTYFSEAVYQLQSATASSTKTDPNWKADARI